MMVDSVEKSIRGSLARLGDDVVYIDRFPWDGGHGKWWLYLKRPYPNYKDYKALQENTTLASAVSMRIILGDKELQYRDNKMTGVGMGAITYDFGEVYNLDVEEGRYFTPQETQMGQNTVILGHSLAKELFPFGADPIGKEIKAMRKRVRVVGVLKKEGKSLLGDGFDNVALLPYNFMRRYIDVNSRRVRPLLAVKASEGVGLDDLKDDIRRVIRSSHKLRPRAEDDFAMNQVSLLSSFLDNIFAIVNFAGLIIGLFSILVGGFGIANIMFVSVKERTNIIGIKKSLGAKSHFILFEFLIESVCLCILGGLLGLVLVLGVTVIGNAFIDSFELVLSFRNVVWGILISMVIGVVSGFLPALSAARMNPVEAIRQK